MKKYKFTILLLLTFVIAFPVITVKLVTAEQEKKARRDEVAKVKAQIKAAKPEPRAAPAIRKAAKATAKAVLKSERVSQQWQSQW